MRAPPLVASRWGHRAGVSMPRTVHHARSSMPSSDKASSSLSPGSKPKCKSSQIHEAPRSCPTPRWKTCRTSGKRVHKLNPSIWAKGLMFSAGCDRYSECGRRVYRHSLNEHCGWGRLQALSHEPCLWIRWRTQCKCADQAPIDQAAQQQCKTHGVGATRSHGKCGCATAKAQAHTLGSRSRRAWAWEPCCTGCKLRTARSIESFAKFSRACDRQHEPCGHPSIR